MFAEDKDTKLHPILRRGFVAAYYYTKMVAYHFLVLTLGFFLMIFYALMISIGAFSVTWCIGPMLQMIMVSMSPFVQVAMKIVVIFCAPCTAHCVKAIRKICPQRWYKEKIAFD